MKKRIRIKGIPFSTTDHDIRRLCEPISTVQFVSIPVHPMSTRPLGLAIVDLGAEADAAKLVAALDGTRLNGQVLRVEVVEY